MEPDTTETPDTMTLAISTSLSRAALLPLFALTCAIFVLTGCQNKNPAGEHADGLAELQLVLEQSFGTTPENESVLNGEVRALIVDSLSTVFVLTDFKGASTIHAYDELGNEKWVIDQTGRGPGDLRSAWGMAWDGQTTLYVSNQVATRIDEFSTDGQYVKSTLAPELGRTRVLVAGFVPPSTLIAYESIAGEFGARLIVIDTVDWTIADTFSVIQTRDQFVPDMVAFAPSISVVDDHIFASNDSRYEYSSYTLQGLEHKSYSRPEVDIEPPAIWGSELSPSFTKPSETFGAVGLGSDFIVAGGRWPQVALSQDQRKSKAYGKGGGTEKVTNLDFFETRTNSLVYSLAAESFGIKRLLGSDSKGRLYAELTGMELVIGRFRVEGLDARPR